MSDRWFYLFLSVVALGSICGWLFIRQIDFVRDNWLRTYFDIGAVIGMIVLIALFVQRLRGMLND